MLFKVASSDYSGKIQVLAHFPEISFNGVT